MLWLALLLPELPLQVYTRSGIDAPLAVVAGHPRPCVIATSPLARALGVEPGQGVAAALAVAPALQLQARTPALEAETLAEVACWAGAYSPRISLVPPDAVLLEIESSLKLFGGACAIADAIHEGLARLGLQASLATAPTPLAARWFARTRPGMNDALLPGWQAFEPVNWVSRMARRIEHPHVGSNPAVAAHGDLPPHNERAIMAYPRVTADPQRGGIRIPDRKEEIAGAMDGHVGANDTPTGTHAHDPVQVRACVHILAIFGTVSLEERLTNHNAHEKKIDGAERDVEEYEWFDEQPGNRNAERALQPVNRFCQTREPMIGECQTAVPGRHESSIILRTAFILGVRRETEIPFLALCAQRARKRCCSPAWSTRIPTTR